MSAQSPGWVLLGCTTVTRETLHLLARRGALPSQLVTITPETATKNGVSNYADLAVDCQQLAVPYVQLQTYGMSEVVSIFAEQIERSLGRGNLDINGRSTQLAAFVVSQIEGSLLLYRLNRNEALLRENVDCALSVALRSQPLARAS